MLVAHRLSTVVDADLILVLERSRLVEQGTHAELAVQRGAVSPVHGQRVLCPVAAASRGTTCPSVMGRREAEDVVRRVPMACTRGVVLAAYRERAPVRALAELAALLQRAAPGVRVM